jgi:hypothetical protein
VNQAVNNFVQAKEKKENEQISINAIQSLLGISDPNLAKAIVKDPAVGKAFQIQREQQQLAADREQEMELAKLEAAQAPKPSAFAEKMALGVSLGLPIEDVFSRLVSPSTTNINTGEPVDTGVIKDTVKADRERRADLIQIVDALPEVQQMEDFLKEGAVITGSLANAELTLKALSNKYGESLGIKKFENVESTQAYMNIAGRNIATVISQFGAGVGISNKDIEFAKKIVAADITLTQGALERLVKIMKEKGIREITRYNEDVKRSYQGLNQESSNFILNSLLIPESRLNIGDGFTIPSGTEPYFE